MKVFMAEESSHSVISTPVKAEPEADDTSKISVENWESLTDECNTKAITHIALSIDSVKTSQEIVSRYLKPRFDSCHDSCKYGERPDDESEEKPWKAMRRRVKMPNMPNEHDSVQFIVSDEDKGGKDVTHEPLAAENRIDSHDVKPNPDLIKSLEYKIKTSSDKKKIVVKEKKPSEDSRKHVHGLKPSPNAKFSLLKPQTSSETKLDPSRTNSSDKKGSSLLRSNVSFAKKLQSPNPPEIMEVELVKFERVEKRDSLTDDKSSRSIKKTGNLSSKDRFRSPVKLQPVKPKQPPRSYSDLDRIHGKVGTNSHSETVGKIKASAYKSPAFRSATSDPKCSPSKREHAKAKEGCSNVESSLKALNKNNTGKFGKYTLNNRKASEKVLHVIKIEATEDASCTANDEDLSHGEGSCLLSPHGEDYDSTYNDSEADKLISNGNETTESVHGESFEENNSSLKLKFKSGKIVESDDNAPRRLRFRKARTLNVEDDKCNLKKKIFKRAESNNDDDATNAQPSSVVLKRQDAQGKKDAQGLLNNVIKETASKLVETRKSKVQALVGAFETVISLQESKTSS